MNPYEREIRLNHTVAAPLPQVWDKWTTREGLLSFFARDVNLELKIDGKYEILFLLDNEPGLQGAETCRIIRLEPHTRLAFTWNAPPHLPTVRPQHTVCEIRFTPATDTTTGLEFVHTGWGDSEEWDQAFEYFTKAWPRVFQALEDSFNPPKH